ncbi:MBL fold metallo-hydrolase [Bacillus lacus]|uniref:MBL fold metallo-hydrolase n=1 Tax=Metabacillus lacus TaxID=1983721 RepID=A0A7X2J166_9BACI|nr:MBL fold metallo-hydrolase [Metabacillus lacus]MRX73548.1 MBL fold metallo-hydrolase [Metabacillus lacus]
MKLTVIGYWGGYPAANEASSGYLVESGDFRLLVDCGSAVLSQLQNYAAPENLDAIIVSHYHHDHIADIGGIQHALLIQSFLGKKREALPIYGHNEDEGGFAGLTYKSNTRGVAYYPDQELEIGPLTIRFLKTVHPVPCYAMRITDGVSTILYTADTSYKDELISFAEEADVLIAECNLYGDQDGSGAGHMNSRDVAKLAREADVKEVILTHLPHFGNHDNLVKETKETYDGPVRLAASGLVWEGEA